MIQQVSSCMEIPGCPNMYFALYTDPRDELVFTAMGKFYNLSLEKRVPWAKGHTPLGPRKSMLDFCEEIIGWEGIILLAIIRSQVDQDRIINQMVSSGAEGS